MSVNLEENPATSAFYNYESVVRSYCRDLPAVLATARGSELFDESGRRWIDFFAGAGALNYGHNHPRLKAALIDYVAGDGIAHSLDLYTVAKRRFLERFHEVILAPRGLDYRVQFTGPTGTNAVEAALKLARKYTGRSTVVSFTNGFHGMTLGALSVTGNSAKREGAGVPLPFARPMPFAGWIDGDVDSLSLIRQYLEDGSSGLDQPAAFIVETLQGEGGLHQASAKWLRGLAQLARDQGALLIVDDIQAGCGRTGPFFSFEEAGIVPDMVTLSKSISGFGQPMALVLVRPELDVWSPGEHNGTFRGNNLAFVTATEALEFWTDDSIAEGVAERAEIVRSVLEELRALRPDLPIEVRGRGLFQGLHVDVPGVAGDICAAAFRRGLIMETAGFDSDVAKIMPPLNIPIETLREGLNLLRDAAGEVLAAVGVDTDPRPAA